MLGIASSGWIYAYEAEIDLVLDSLEIKDLPYGWWRRSISISLLPSMSAYVAFELIQLSADLIC